MFTSARIKLAFTYTFLIILISGSMSTLFYQRTTDILGFEYTRMKARYELEIIGIEPPRIGRGRLIFDNEDLESAKKQILWQLIRVNGLIVIIFGIGGYWLSGFTLKPIQKAMEQQDRFITDVTHELKTPLTGLKTSLEVNLMDKSLDKKAVNILKENLEDVSSLQKLIDNLFKLSINKITRIRLEKVNLDEIVNKAAKLIQPLAEKKNIIILIDKSLSKLEIHADEGIIMELLLILLDNAIKYSSNKSEIKITSNQHNKIVELSIADQGVGISKDELEHIFDRFYRADKSRNKSKVDGYGLGLSVAKELVKLINGEITVKSEIGKGSVFTLQFIKNNY